MAIAVKCNSVYNPTANRGESRVSEALVLIKNPNPPTVRAVLGKGGLSNLALKTNAALVHFSGNCALLSRCMLFNLRHLKDRVLLGAKNTAPFYEGVDEDAADKLLF